MNRFIAHRAIATLHSFRFHRVGLRPTGLRGGPVATRLRLFAAYSDLAAAVLALMALITARWRPVSNIVEAHDEKAFDGHK